MREPSPKRALAADLAFAKFDADCIIAGFRNVAIAIWIDGTSLPNIKDAQTWLRELASVFPDGIAFLQIIGEDHPGIDAGARTALDNLLRSGRTFIREAPVVYEGTGFRAAAVRAVVTGIFSQRSLGFPHRVYSSVEDAALAIGRRFEKREPARFARELCEALAAIRDRHFDEFPSAPKSFIRLRQ